VTLLTSRGRIVVLHKSRETPEGLYSRLEPVDVLIASEPAAKQLAALYNNVERSGPVTIMVKDLLLRLGEPVPTPEARCESYQDAGSRRAHGKPCAKRCWVALHVDGHAGAPGL
jgi:hypothetical protein